MKHPLAHRSLRLGRIVAAAATLSAAAAQPAMAYIAPGATIVSASQERLEQADDTTVQVALSGDGNYAVFSTRARNFFADDDPDPPGQFRSGGIFRRDLQTGSLALVARGDLRPEDAPDTILIRGALNPSVSADGRYVAFSSGWKLSPDDTNGNVDVYVRDMSRAVNDPGAYELVSRTDSDAPVRYAPLPAGQDRPGVNQGTDVTPRSAISADGRTVVFKTAGVKSDLPAEPDITTEGQQALVRNLDAGTTRLVTRNRSDGTPAGGALGAVVLSADGSTVVWVARNAPAQTTFLPGEGDNPAVEYYLWRRVADGDGAVTRRVTGFVDPEDPACPPGTPVVDNPNLSGPCYGPLNAFEGVQGGIVSQTPAVSADGRRVAYLTSATTRGVAAAGFASDLYVTDVIPGTSRKTSTIELSRDGGPTAATNAPYDGVAMSADGRWVAATTLRTGQILPLLRQLGTVRAQPIQRDVQLIDLTDRTTERASIGTGGSDTDGPASALPAISADGRRIAFVSAASNLFFGDANNRPDAFVVSRLDAEPVEAPVVEPPPEPATAAAPVVSAPKPAPALRLVVRASKGKRSVVAIRISVPEAGRGTALARGRLRNADGKRTGGIRTLAKAAFKAKKASKVAVKLTVPKSLRKRLKAAGRLTASTQVEFKGASGKTYVGRVTVEFVP